MIRTSTLVAVADGGTARFFTWPKASDHLAEQQDLRMDISPAAPERGPSPRVQDSTGHHRHRVERRLSAHEENEERFLADVADRIVTVMMTKVSARSLILCAPPKALGVLRAALAKRGLSGEPVTVDKDLTKETAEELDARLRRLAAP